VFFAGYGGILVGAAGWWLVITTLFDRLREKITWSQLRLINRITGSIIVALALVGIVSVLLEKGF
jgi:hypothetical protein